MRKYTQHYQVWRELYESGVSTVEIGKMFNVDYRTVWAALKSMGVERRPVPEHLRHEELESLKDECIRLYTEGVGPTEIAKRLGISKTSVHRYLRSAGVTPKGLSYWATKYPVRNENAFERINTDEKAYYLGFLMADGNILLNTRGEPVAVQVCLSEQDRELLESLAKFVGTDAPLYERPDRNALQLRIYSRKLARDLCTCGCVPNKTFTLQFPPEETVPKGLLGAFVRGYFDGDGGIIKTHSGARVVIACASLSFAGSMLDAFSDVCSNGGVHLRKQGKIYYVVIERKTLLNKIYHWFYDTATVWLPRKRKKYEEVLGISNNSE